jgi:DNA primase large subunit
LNIRIELVNHYPWLPSLKDHYADLSAEDFIKELFNKYPKEEIQKRILTIFKAAFQNLEQVPNYQSDELNVYLYLLLKILLYVLDDKSIKNRIANLYSKVNRDELMRDSDANLYDICQDLDLEVQYFDTPIEFGANVTKNQTENLETNFRIHFIDYLKLVAHMRDDYRKLINNPLTDGFVFIQKKSLTRLLQEHVRVKVLPKESDDEATVLAFREKCFETEGFKELYDMILEEWKEKKEDLEIIEFKFTKGSDLSDSFPPCLKEILQKAQDGVNLTHNERLFLVFSLHALEYPVEKIVDIFSVLPDFNREKTLYQVNFALEKKYTPHKCDTLKSLNLCMAEKYKDELCLDGYYSRKTEEQKKISHPLFYIQIKQYRTSRPQNTPNTQARNEND